MMTTDQDSSNRATTGTWEKARNIIGIVLLVVTSYELGLGRGRSEKSMGEYSALKAQYGQIEKEYSALRQEYDRIETEYSALKSQYNGMEAEYARLKAQYDRIEKQRARTLLNEPKQ